MVWTPLVRKYTAGVEFGDFRERIEKNHIAVHDELSDCYYNGKPFRTFGILDKETFDKLHGLIFHLLAIHFHTRNMLRLPANRIPEDCYRYTYDGSKDNRIDLIALAQERIAARRAEGIDFDITGST